MTDVVVVGVTFHYKNINSGSTQYQIVLCSQFLIVAVF